MKPSNPIYIGNHRLDPPEDAYECPKCGTQFDYRMPDLSVRCPACNYVLSEPDDGD